MVSVFNSGECITIKTTVVNCYFFLTVLETISMDTGFVRVAPFLLEAPATKSEHCILTVYQKNKETTSIRVKPKVILNSNRFTPDPLFMSGISIMEFSFK